MSFSAGVHRLATPKHRRRPVSAALFRRRRCRVPANRLFLWKLDDLNKLSSSSSSAAVGAIGGGPEVPGGRVRGAVEVSARKLAARLWKLHSFLKCGSCDRVGFQPGVEHASIMFPHYHTRRKYIVGREYSLQSPPSTLSGPKHAMLYKSAMEGATKWDHSGSQASIECHHFTSHMKVLEGKVRTVSAVSTLQAELIEAQSRIHELEAEQCSSKRKVEYLLRKLEEKEVSWKSGDHQKISAVIDDLKHELSKERRDAQRVEARNSKLIKELAEANLSAMQVLQDYEEEKKARHLMEEVCNELAKKIGEDEAKIEALRRETIELREVVEEERKMLQMAEVWREERIQLKLVDAKLALEDKFTQMNKLVTDLETFLRQKSTTLDVMELEKAELIKQQVKSVNIEDMKEFAYTSPKSRDVYSIVEEILHIESSKRDIEACVSYSPEGSATCYHPLSLEANCFGENNLEPKHSNRLTSYNSCFEEDARGWKIASHAVGRGSNYSLEGSEPLMSRITSGKNALKGGTEYNKNRCEESPGTEISEVCSVSVSEQSKQKSSSVSKHWRPSHPKYEFYKTKSHDGNGRFSNVKISSMGSPNRG